MKNHIPRKQVWKNWQKSTETLRCIIWMDFTSTIRARSRSCVEEHELENPRPTTWWSVNGNRLTVQKLQGYFLKDRILFKDGLLFRKYFGETGSVKYYQILIPKQLVNEVLRSLHGDFGKHPGIAKTIIAYGEKYFFFKNGAKDHGVGDVMWKMHQIITNWP